MKRKAMNALRILILLALLIAATVLALRIVDLHRAECPYLYTAEADPGYRPLLLGAALYILLPAAQAILIKASGCRLMASYLLFLHIRWEGGLRIRLGRPGLGTWYLPPRLDGTSPCALPLLSAPLYFLTVSLLCTALLIPYWGSYAARLLMFPAFMGFLLTLVLLLPRRNGTDLLSRVLIFRRSPDYVRAWECATHVAYALNHGQKLPDMPDEWFQTYPAALAEDIYGSNCMINGASRLMRQYRFAEAYAMLRPLFDLTPSPDNHIAIACSILNGAICEALTDLPPMCLSQLEHTSVKYMTPPAWQPRLQMAKYARALLLTHDAAEASALLPEIEKFIREDKADPRLLTLLQAKAGLLPAEKEAL